jgi:hypothetical protein
MENRCSFCEKTFTSKSNLKAHINGAKYCISTRPTTTVVRVIFKCEGCDSELSSKQILDNHKSKCIEFILKKTREEHSKQIASLEKIISEKNIHIKELEDRMHSLLVKAVSKPTVINSTDNRIQQTINNLIPITDDHLKEQAQFLTLDHIKQGALGYANFACDYALKDRITCVDVSRRKVKYKNQDGIVITDPEMSVLSKKLFCSIKDKNTELTRLYKQELREMVLQKFRDSGDDMTDEKTMDLDMAIEQINKHMENASNLDYQVTKIVQGEKPNIYHEFIKEVCNKTVG